MDDPTLDDTLAARAAAWLRPSPAELAGLLILVLGTVMAGGVLWFQAAQRPTALPNDAGVVGAAVAADGTADGPAPGITPEVEHHHGSEPGGGEQGPSAAGSGQVTVHVTGGVAVPGVVELFGGGRVGDAVAAAGGLTADAVPERINLARLLVDGEHVHVPRDGEEELPPGTGSGGVGDGTASSGGVTVDGRVDINRATPEELEALPGIGPARAEAIVAFRAEHGPFMVPGDLRGVSGIGEATFQRLADLVTVG